MMKQKSLKIDFRYLGGNIACLSVDSTSGEAVHNDIDNEEAIIIFNSLVGEKEGCQTVKKILEENQQLKEQLERVEKSNKEAIEYIKEKPLYYERYDYNYDDELELVEISSEQAEYDLLEILDTDEGE